MKTSRSSSVSWLRSRLRSGIQTDSIERGHSTCYCPGVNSRTNIRGTVTRATKFCPSRFSVYQSEEAPASKMLIPMRGESKMENRESRSHSDVAQQADKPPRPEPGPEVHITVNGASKLIHRGRQTVAEIKTVGGVPLADELEQLAEGKLT